ncbi:TIGR03089 family protein [Streptomonospora sp. S1-112]|uniref:TIGR03089 family protein n=1 Tax=Streptomonospora mangrovi TaxID=2883123 RepID=A0A9X3NMD8_9ACTN|nr:TIGR03089 family protein [Streptomonospora mangrovi]MDA0565973.1 TIGR03089 family protein [Streptomonospora mangrovi]
MGAETPVDLWRSAVAADPARPFVTAYDPDTGGRVELSFATVDNWVAKTANMLVDGLGVEPGDRVALALPPHWQSLVWLLACFSTGATAVLGEAGEVPEGDVAVADPARVSAALDTGAREVVGTSLHPLGAPMADCPPTALDYTVEVRGYGDRFFPAAPVDPDTLALAGPPGGPEGRTGAQLVDAARRRLAGWGLTSADRVAMITSARDSLTVLGSDLSLLLGPVAGAVPLVLIPDGESTTLQARLGMERATAIAGARPGTPAIAESLKPLT